MGGWVLVGVPGGGGGADVLQSIYCDTLIVRKFHEWQRDGGEAAESALCGERTSSLLAVSH